MSPVQGTARLLAALADSATARLTGRSCVTVERGPVTQFARAVHDEDPIFQRVDVAHAEGLSNIPAPPTFAFSALEYWGRFPDHQPADISDLESNPLLEAITDLMSTGGVALHGEQEFVYHRSIVVGDVLHRSGALVDQYTKRKSATVLTFLIAEVEYRDPAGELVLTTRSTFVHRGGNGAQSASPER